MLPGAAKLEDSVRTTMLELGGARAGDADAGEGIRWSIGQVRPPCPHRRGTGDERDAVLGHGLERGLGVEPFDRQHRAAAVERQTEHHVQAEDVEERQYAERHVFGGLGTMRLRLHLLEVRQEIAVAEHRGLGEPCSATREHQDGEIVVIAVDDRRGIGCEQRVDGDGTFEAIVLRSGHDEAQARELRLLDGGETAPPGRADDGCHRADVLELSHELGAGTRRVQRNGDRADTEDRQVAGDEVPVVGRDDRYMITGLDAVGDQATAQTADLVPQLAVGGGATP